MHPILFTIGTFSVFSHGVLALLGIIAGTAIIFLLARKSKLKTDFVIDNIIYICLAGIIGARILYFLLYREQFSFWTEIFYLWQGGMVSYGGFILAGIIYFFLLRYQREPIGQWFDIASIGFFAGLFFGRIGNIMAGEYSGVPLLSGFSIDGQFPAPFYESILCILIFVASLVYYLWKGEKKPGGIIAFSWLFYGLGRFVIDIWRSEEKLALGFSLGQLTDLIVVVACAVILIGIVKRKEYYAIR